MKYTSTVNYVPVDPNSLKNAINVSFENQNIDKIDPFSRVYTKANEIFNQEEFLNSSKPIPLKNFQVEDFNLHVLRLLVKEPNSIYILPKALKPIFHLIEYADSYQQNYFPEYQNRFVYITIRAGITRETSVADTFHVDGFQGFSVPRHIPEQNYIWCNSFGTEFLDQGFDITKLDPMIHNVHEYFNRTAKKQNIYSINPKQMYIIDPYHVHRKQNIVSGLKRIFVRITFSAVEIRDDTNTQNPNLIRGPYNREDIRNKLIPFNPES